MTTLLTSLYGALSIIIVALATYLGAILRTLLIVKIKNSKNEHLKYIATLVFNGINEDKRLGQLTNTKIDEFTVRMKSELPNVTDAQIDTVRKGLAGEFNKDKAAVADAIQPIIENAPVITKYFAADGVTELIPVVPVVAPIA